MGGLLSKIFLVDLFRGLWVTFRNQSPKYIYTEQYPTERPKVAERYRGAPRLNINPDTNETLCISCNLCALACPENLIVVTSVRNEQTRRKDLTAFTYDLSRCMFCGLCEDACPVDALELTQDFELASYTREGGIWDRQMLEEGPRLDRHRTSKEYVDPLLVERRIAPWRSSLQSPVSGQRIRLVWMHAQWTASIRKRTQSTTTVVRGSNKLTSSSLTRSSALTTRSSALTAARACQSAQFRRSSRWMTFPRNGTPTLRRTPITSKAASSSRKNTGRLRASTAALLWVSKIQNLSG